MGWSPPEQLSRQPLSSSADVYTSGLLLVSALGCQQLGRTVSYRMPEGEVVEFVEDPTVYMDPDSEVLGDTGRHEWFELVEKALRSRPDERWGSASELRDGLKDLMSLSTVRGRIAAAYAWGDRPSIVRSEDGTPQVGWIVVDHI